MADIRALTTEAHNHAQREAFTDALAHAHGSGVFEMSTCNRVVYAGLCDEVAQLKTAVENLGRRVERRGGIHGRRSLGTLGHGRERA